MLMSGLDRLIHVHVIIPARFFRVTRLPGKPLLDIAATDDSARPGSRRCQSQAASVTVATDDQRIAEACHGFRRRRLVLNPRRPSSGTIGAGSRQPSSGLQADPAFVNVQGDEP